MYEKKQQRKLYQLLQNQLKLKDNKIHCILITFTFIVKLMALDVHNCITTKITEKSWRAAF